MKKILTIITGVLFACMVNAQETDNVAKWDFPVRYGTPEWEKLESFEERMMAYNIPDELIRKISTPELVKVCLAYPEWRLIHAFDDRRTGLSYIMSQFNGFHELLSRRDATKELIRVYAKMDPLAIEDDWTAVQKGRYVFNISYVELMLSVRRVIENLDEQDRQALSNEVVLKYRQKKQRPDVYGLWELSPIAGLGLNIIDRDGEFSKNDAKLRSLKQHFITDDMEVLDRIFESVNSQKK